MQQLKYIGLIAIFFLAVAALAVRAADVATSYGVPGSPSAPRINPVVTLCPSADGSNSVVACNTVVTSRVIVPLDAASVVTGGTAVTALAAGHRTAGGWLQNPSTATVNLCINEVGTASGAVSAGSTTCIVPGQSYTLIASGNAVSVIASDAAHGFSGYGLQ